MAQNESLNPSAYYNIFKVSLTREQQTVLTDFLPTNYSFQPFKCTRSLDDESLRSQPPKVNKSKGQRYIEKNREQKDPDYSASYVIMPNKEPPPVKIQSSQTIPGGQPFMECYNILRRLKKSFYSWPFRAPVDPKALGIPEYSNIVLEPMDLKTIEDNIRKEIYKHPAQFHRDIYKILMNSYKFNQKNSQVFFATSDFEEQYLRVLKEAKEGKLLPPQKKVKIEGSVEEDTPMMMREKSSFEQKPKSYQKKEKQEKDQLKEKIKEKPKQKIKEERVKQEEKEFEKYESIDKTQKLKEKEKTKEMKELKEKMKEEKMRRKYQIQSQKMKQKQKQREKQEKEKQRQRQKQKQKQRQKEKEKEKMQAEQQKQKNNEFMEFSELFDATNQRALCKSEKDDISISNDPNVKKSRIKLTQSKRQKKLKDKAENSQTLKEIKELKEVTQFENEKGIIVTNIQKKLTDLLKKFSEYQFPKPKQKIPLIRNTQVQHPNFNNFSNITTSEKKRLAEKIYQLPSSQLNYIIQICYRKRDRKRDEEGVFEFDLQKMDAKTLKELSNFVAMRTKHIKKAPRGRNESSRVASSQMQPAEQQYVQANFQFEAQQDDFHQDQAQFDSLRERRFGSEQNELILQHPGDDIHSHMLEQNFHFPSGELMEIDDDVRSDSYAPDGESYQF